MSLHRKYLLELWRTDRSLLLYLFGFPYLKITSYIVFIVAAFTKFNKTIVTLAQIISLLGTFCGIMAIVMFIWDSVPSKKRTP